MMCWVLTGKFEPTFSQLETMKLHKSAFVVISVIGQELLAGGYYSAAVVVLESALKIGTTNIKLKGSVISALSSAYWALNSLEKVYIKISLFPIKNILFLSLSPYKSSVNTFISFFYKLVLAGNGGEEQQQQLHSFSPNCLAIRLRNIQTPCCRSSTWKLPSHNIELI